MSESSPHQTAKPTWSLTGLREGALLGVPVLPGMIVFGIAVGTAAERKGIGFIDNFAMNFFVYAGAAQMVALEIWPQVFTWSAIAALAVITAIVNARLILMSASMQTWFGPLPAWQSYPSLYFLTDPGWLISMRYRGEGGNDAAVYAGMTLLFLVGWMSAVCAGHMLGGLIADPRRFGFDLVMPVFFAILLIPLWRGSRRATGWGVAGLVALAVEWLVPGWWFIIAGSVAGAVAGGLMDEREAAAS